MPSLKQPPPASKPDAVPRNPAATLPESSPARRSAAGKPTARSEPPTRQGGSGQQGGESGSSTSQKSGIGTAKHVAKPNIETYTAQLLLELIEGRPDPQKLQWLESDVQIDFRWTGSGGSWNHWHIAIACALWATTARITAASTVIADRIVRYLEAQLGEAIAEPTWREFPMLRYFGGTEQFSNTYEGWRWGVTLAIRLWALRHPEHPQSARLLYLTARYNEVQTALLALGSAPGWTKIGEIISRENDGSLRRDTVNPHSHRSGRQIWWPGPSLPQSGARSTPGHIGVDDRLPVYCACMFGKLVDADIEKRFGWTATVLRHLQRHGNNPNGPSPSYDANALAGIRLLVPHHFLYWEQEGIRLNYMERLANGNTTSILGHLHYEKEDRAVYLFPWPGRIRSGLGSAQCEIKGDRGKLRLVASSQFGEVSVDIPSREPDTHVSIGTNGVIV